MRFKIVRAWPKSDNITSGGAGLLQQGMQTSQAVIWFEQAPRQWSAKLSSTLCEYGFVRFYADYSPFTYRKRTTFLALLVYVDDIILARNDPRAYKEFEDDLSSCFRINDLEPLKYFLGFEVAIGQLG